MVPVEDLLMLNLMPGFDTQQRACHYMLGHCLMINDFKCPVEEALKLLLNVKLLPHFIMISFELEFLKGKLGRSLVL